VFAEFYEKKKWLSPEPSYQQTPPLLTTNEFHCPFPLPSSCPEDNSLGDILAARDSLTETIMQTEFRFRLNGNIMPEIFIQQKTVAGEPTGEREIAVNVDGLGWFTIDDNSNLWDDALPQFVLEYRDETSWALIPVEVCRTMKDKGWNRVTPQELIAILESAGAIQRI
jgi:hypothetical protein